MESRRQQEVSARPIAIPIINGVPYYSPTPQLAPSFTTITKYIARYISRCNFGASRLGCAYILHASNARFQLGE